MSYFVTDVESDGGLLGSNSMVCFGIVKLTPELDTTFYGKTRPVCDNYDPQALAVSGFSRAEHETFDDPEEVFRECYHWVKDNSKGRPVLISDNPGYDASWMNWYFLTYCGENPFGWSSRRIGDIYCGMREDMWASWKKFRTTKHTHHPVDDAMGNAEALLRFKEMGLKIETK